MVFSIKGRKSKPSVRKPYSNLYVCCVKHIIPDGVRYSPQRLVQGFHKFCSTLLRYSKLPWKQPMKIKSINLILTHELNSIVLPKTKVSVSFSKSVNRNWWIMELTAIKTKMCHLECKTLMKKNKVKHKQCLKETYTNVNHSAWIKCQHCRRHEIRMDWLIEIS